MGRAGHHRHPARSPHPCAIRTHTRSAIPFLIWNREMHPDSVQTYDECAAHEGSYGLLQGNQFMKAIFNPE